MPGDLNAVDGLNSRIYFENIYKLLDTERI